MNKFGQALGQVLIERGMTQSELARRLGITSSSVNLWVRGHTLPSRENLRRIEEELKVDSLWQLVYVTDEPAQPTVESLLRADSGIFDEDKRAILRIIRMARDRFAAES